MKHLHAGLAVSLALTAHALDASAQDSPQTVPVNPPASAWPVPPPGPPPGAQPYAQPVYMMPPPAYAMPFASRRPTRIPYEGGPVPPGARIDTRARLGMIIGGSVTFGVLWLSSAFVGSVVAGVDDRGSTGSSPAWWFVAPVIGPVAFGLSVGLEGPLWVFLGIDSIAQGAGLVMLIYGVLNPVPYLVFDGVARAPTPPRPRWALLPGNGATLSGASFALTF